MALSCGELFDNTVAAEGNHARYTIPQLLRLVRE
jgi:hypothetical protein